VLYLAGSYNMLDVHKLKLTLVNILVKVNLAFYQISCVKVDCAISIVVVDFWTIDLFAMAVLELFHIL
jgi:hypothetical protein